MEYTKIILNEEEPPYKTSVVKQGRMLVNESGALLIVRQGRDGKSVTLAAYAHGMWRMALATDANGELLHDE